MNNPVRRGENEKKNLRGKLLRAHKISSSILTRRATDGPNLSGEKRLEGSESYLEECSTTLEGPDLRPGRKCRGAVQSIFQAKKGGALRMPTRIFCGGIDNLGEKGSSRNNHIIKGVKS